MPVHKLAERIRADRIDVLIDLSGWTTGGRAGRCFCVVRRFRSTGLDTAAPWGIRAWLITLSATR